MVGFEGWRDLETDSDGIVCLEETEVRGSYSMDNII